MRNILFNKFGIWFSLLHCYSISHGNPEKKKIEKNSQFGNENKNNKVANFFTNYCCEQKCEWAVSHKNVRKKIARWTCTIAFPKIFNHWTRKNTGNRHCPIKLMLLCLFLFFEKNILFFHISRKISYNNKNGEISH